MNYTKGPWILEAGRSFKTVSGDFYITYGKDRHGNPNFKNFVELDNNAHLISAAPDCYEILKRILQAHDSKNNGAYIGEAVLCREFADIARSAIAKAEGRL